MIKSDFSQPVPDELGAVHFVGIGGAGMSGIARLFVDAGYRVTGSDIRSGATVEALQAAGVKISIGHDAANVAGADTVVVTGAIAEDNPEYLAARASGVPIIHRAQALAWLTNQSRLVAVAGAHGKTTTTSLTAAVLGEGGLDPTFVIGGRVEGTITATERVDVQATASVSGDIHTKSIVVQEGGKINGTVKMTDATSNTRSIEPKPQPVAVVR